MKRIQFYPEQQLDNVLENEAKKYGVSVSALVNAKLCEVYNLTEKNQIPLPQLTANVINEIEAFIDKNATNTGMEFDLLMASDIYKNIEMTGNGKPKTIRANIGISFKKKVDSGHYPNVEIAFKENGKKKLSSNNALMYKIV